MTFKLKLPRLFVIALLATITFIHSNICEAQQDTITIASFKIANFGDSDEYKRSLIALVNTILETDADILAIQEVEPNSLGKNQIQKLTEVLNKASNY